MMKFSQMAGKYFQDVEIIELHHDQKLDAPSGTAVKTAEMIAEVREAKKQGHPNEKETIQGARGADYVRNAYSFCSVTRINCTSASYVWFRWTNINDSS